MTLAGGRAARRGGGSERERRLLRALHQARVRACERGPTHLMHTRPRRGVAGAPLVRGGAGWVGGHRTALRVPAVSTDWQLPTAARRI